MKFTIGLLALVPAVFAALKPENAPRPSRRGFSTISGTCDPSGVTQTLSGQQGTLKACSQTCTDSKNCAGFNFLTDQNQCAIFATECADTRPVAAASPVQNFYLKGEIACSTSTVGNEFWVAFMANRVAQPKNLDLEIWITQDTNIAGAVVTLEAQGISRPIQVPYKTAVKTTIPYTWKVTDVDAGVTIERKGLKLSSPVDFVFYGVNKEYFTADAYLGIPTRSLGTRYLANCMWPSFYNCEFAITPTDDNTTITITLPRKATTNAGQWAAAPPSTPQACALPYKGQTYTNGQTFTITLNTFEVAQIQDPCDLTGAIISSNKPIAFWSGDSRTNIGNSPSRDHQVEQLFSVDTWGTDCAAWPTPKRVDGLVDYWVITANSDGTTVQVDSNERAAQNFQLNAGESVRFPANSVNEWMRFSSDKKFQSVKYASSAVDNSIPGDPSMTVCIPSDQFGFGYTFVTPTGVSSTYSNYLSLITSQGAQNGFVLDGQPVSGVQWTNIPNSDLVGGFVQLDSAKQQFRIEHATRGTRFEAYIYGAGDRESIAYPTGACIQALGQCETSQMFIADGKDNDCDGVVDEELFDGIDNDFDGKIDEDCYRIKPVDPDRCPEVKTAQACYGGQLQMKCDNGVINVIEAHFGRLGRAGEMTCGAENTLDSCGGSDADCGFADVSGFLRTSCNGKQNCGSAVNNYALGNLYASSKCPVCALYAHAQYTCLTAKEQAAGVLSGNNYQSSSTAGSAGTCSAKCKSGSSCANWLAAPASRHDPSNAAFTASTVAGWRPSSCDNDNSWLQIDLGGQFQVGWYAISGCRKSDQWVSSFGLSWSADGTTWTDIKEATGALKAFTGNSDAISAHSCTIFAQGITARWIRVIPLQYNGAPCLHVDFGHGSDLQGCANKNGVSNSNFANGGTASFGTSAAVKCNAGWSTQNGDASYSVACNADGTWGAAFAPCNKVRACSDIPSVDGGYSVAKNTMPGSTVKFTCQAGRRLNGASSITCKDDGTWSAPAPKCDQ